MPRKKSDLRVVGKDETPDNPAPEAPAQTSTPTKYPNLRDGKPRIIITLSKDMTQLETMQRIGPPPAVAVTATIDALHYLRYEEVEERYKEIARVQDQLNRLPILAQNEGTNADEDGPAHTEV